MLRVRVRVRVRVKVRVRENTRWQMWHVLGWPGSEVGARSFWLLFAWPEILPAAPRVTVSTMVAHEGVPACLLLGHADGSLCTVDTP